MKVGLALTGGGSKGAYQVGMLRAFAELGGQVDAVAGASVGALNAAVVACSPSLEVAVERLQRIWTEEVPYVSLVESAGSERARVIWKKWEAVLDLPRMPGLREGLLPKKEPVREILAKYVDFAALEGGLPLYVSIYKSLGTLEDLLRFAAAELGVADTGESEFAHIQSLPDDERIECLLASAALPVVFAPVKVRGSHYSDGGQGSWWTQKGNTPVEPLVVREKCDGVVVMHAQEGSLWSRDDHPNAMVLEIRPTSTPSTFPIKDLVERNPRVISSWIEQGYSDGMRVLRRVMEAVESRNTLRRSRDELRMVRQRVQDSEDKKEQAEAHLESIFAGMRRNTDADSR